MQIYTGNVFQSIATVTLSVFTKMANFQCLRRMASVMAIMADVTSTGSMNGVGYQAAIQVFIRCQ